MVIVGLCGESEKVEATKTKLYGQALGSNPTECEAFKNPEQTE